MENRATKRKLFAFQEKQGGWLLSKTSQRGATTRGSIGVAASAMIAMFLPSCLTAQEQYCIPPIMPIVPQNNDMIVEFRAELIAEYEQYITDASEYLNCLNTSGMQTRDDMQKVIEQFSVIIGGQGGS